MTSPITWLRLEGAVLLGAALWYFSYIGGNWWLFAALILVFDISMVGYLKNPRLGALTYNLGHALILPVLVLLIWHEQQVVVQVSTIWIAHIGMDRLFGYGLKHADRFEHTHLGIIGKTKH